VPTPLGTTARRSGTARWRPWCDRGYFSPMALRGLKVCGRTGGAAVATFGSRPRSCFPETTQFLHGGLEGTSARRWTRSSRRTGAVGSIAMRSGSRSQNGRVREKPSRHGVTPMTRRLERWPCRSQDLAGVDCSELDAFEASLEEFWHVDGLDGLVPELDLLAARDDGRQQRPPVRS